MVTLRTPYDFYFDQKIGRTSCSDTFSITMESFYVSMYLPTDNCQRKTDTDMFSPTLTFSIKVNL